MKREDFVKTVAEQVNEYIGNFDRFDENPQLRVNPVLLFTDIINGKDMLNGIGYSEEAIENAAYAEGDETMSSTDFQSKEDPDFYPVKGLLKPSGPHTSIPDLDAIEKVADNYNFEK